MQGRSDKIPPLLKKENSRSESEGFIDKKPPSSSKSDSGISLQYKDNSKSSTQDQPEKRTVEKPGSKGKELHAVLNDDMEVLIVKEEDRHNAKVTLGHRKLAHYNSELVLIINQKDLEEFISQHETDI